jgi:SNF2 family DNA or RNA helicase
VESSEEDRDAKINDLLRKIRGYYLRRLKDNVLELPEKKIQIIDAELSDDQFRIYQGIARAAKAGGRGAMLAAISKLLMLCADPATAQGFDVKAEAPCTKLEKTIDTLETIQKRNEKVIIFTDYKIVQRTLQNAIRQKLGIWPDIINGEITSNRQRIIDIFSERPGFNAIILGHQVAGVGLNITAANHVIHYTRPWNPAKENQATDRAHRIGQDKTVIVYYPIIRDERFKTVEERLDELIRSKEKLARDVLRPTKEMQVKAEELFDCIDEASGDTKL